MNGADLAVNDGMKKQGMLGAAFLAGALLASAVVSYRDTGSWTPWGRASFPVEVSVDFGPAAQKAGKPAIAKEIFVDRGTTPKEAVSQVVPVLSGKSCCSFREVIGIDGIKIEPAKNRWWICLLNGSRNLSPHQKKLKRGDKIEWRYIEDAQ